MRYPGLARLGAVCALITALGPVAPAAPRAHADDRVVHLWHAYAGAEEEALREAARAFSRGHPGVRVELLANAFGAYAAKLESAIPTGRGPDVFIDAHERLSRYEAAHLLAPFGELDEAPYEPAHVEALRLGGALYGVPLSVKCAALYLRSGLVPDDPASLEALGRADLPEGVYPLVFEAENAYYVAALLHAYGGRMLDDDGRYAFVGPEAEATLAHLRRMVESGMVPEEASGELVQRMFAGGRAAAAISGPWLAPDLPGDLDFRVVPLPTVEGAGDAPMRPFATVEAAFVAQGAREPELARELARFLAGPEGAVVRGTVGRQIVANRAAWSDPALAGDRLLSTFRQAAAQATPMPSHPNMSLTFEPAQRVLRSVLRGGEDIPAALRGGVRRFEDVTRPMPPPQDPTFALVLLGLLLLVAVLSLVERARRPEVRLALRKSVPAYKYVAHAFVAVGLLVVAPLVVGAGTSFFAGRGRDLYYAGWANYVDILTARGGDLLSSGSFYVVLLVTVLWTVLNLALHVGIGVVLALLLNRPAQKLKAAYRVALILPWAVPSYVTALAWKGMFHRQFGAINAILESLGAEPVSWFGQFSTAFAANLATNVWLGFPFMMVITLGALTSIPKELYEAAAVDGATAWQRFRHVTLPLLVPSIAPAVAMGAVWTFNMFNVVFLVSGGEPDGSTEILVSEAYRWAFTRGSQYGYAAAYAVLIFVLLVLFTRAGAKKLEAAEGS